MFVVCEEDHYGSETGYSVTEIYGPFSSERDAQTFCDKMNAEDRYAVTFRARRLASPVDRKSVV